MDGGQLDQKSKISAKGGSFDIQNSLSNIPGFSWSKYKSEKHLPGYQYLGPSTRLDIRLDENDIPKTGEEPINQTDAIAYQHDLAYRDSKSSSNIWSIRETS